MPKPSLATMNDIVKNIYLYYVFQIYCEVWCIIYIFSHRSGRTF